MTCSNCHSVTARVRIVDGTERCSVCGGFSEANGERSDGVLSRQRTRDQGVKYEGDTLNPWKYEKSSKSYVPDPDFVKRHAHNAHHFFQPGDLKAYPKLAETVKNPKREVIEATGEGSYSREISKVIGQGTTA